MSTQDSSWKDLCLEDCEKPRRIHKVGKSLMVALPKCLEALGLAAGAIVKLYIEDIVFENGKIREVKMSMKILKV